MLGKAQWVTEADQTKALLDHLDAAETELYRTLIDGDLGPSIRLEQERIRYPLVEAALWGASEVIRDAGSDK